MKSLKLDFPTGSPEGILIFSYSNIGGGGRGRGVGGVGGGGWGGEGRGLFDRVRMREF